MGFRPLFLQLHRNGGEGQFWVDHRIEIWVGSSSGILCNKPVFSCPCRFQALWDRTVSWHGMLTGQSNTKHFVGVGVSGRGNRVLLNFQNCILDLISFFFFFFYVLKAQLSQALEEVGNHKQRAEMVSDQFLPCYLSPGCFIELYAKFSSFKRWISSKYSEMISK